MTLVLAIASRDSVTLSSDRQTGSGATAVLTDGKLAVAQWSKSEAAVIGWSGPATVVEHWETTGPPGTAPRRVVTELHTTAWLQALLDRHRGSVLELLEVLRTRAPQVFGAALVEAHSRMAFLVAAIAEGQPLLAQLQSWDFDGQFTLRVWRDPSRGGFSYTGQVQAVAGKTLARLRELARQPMPPAPASLAALHRRVAAHPTAGPYCSRECDIVRLSADGTLASWHTDAAGRVTPGACVLHPQLQRGAA